MTTTLASFILAATLFTRPIDVLVLRSGAQIPVSGSVQVDGQNLVFRHPNGVVYSIPLEEIDVQATDNPIVVIAETGTSRKETGAERRLRVTDEEKTRLLKELEANHSGKPAPPSQAPKLPPRRAVEALDVTERNDESYWREKAARLEENLLRRKEDFQLLTEREHQLNDQILALLSLGYRPDQFSYQAMQLQRTRDSMDQARLSITRAERELARFRDEARREGILPGWLR